MFSQAEMHAQPAADYMSGAQREFFRTLLLTQRRQLQTQISRGLEQLREREPCSDPADQAHAEEQRQWQVRVLERDKQLLDKIDQALQRLARGEYGWCSETGEPIGLPRLLLRPTATLCIEAKARQELREKHIRERRGNTYE